MTTVGIRILKEQLSRYVAKVVSGESLIVADRGKPVAMMCPLPEAMQGLEELKTQGAVTWSGRKPTFTARKRRPARAKDPGVGDAVIEDRR